jgi:DNA-directed RNA polymerase sigma subunit (sigma70/sigma32)
MRYNLQAYEANLTELEMTVIKLYYGLGYNKPYSYKRIALIWSLSTNFIQKLKRQADSKLHTAFGKQVIIDLKRHRRKQL